MEGFIEAILVNWFSAYVGRGYVEGFVFAGMVGSKAAKEACAPQVDTSRLRMVKIGGIW